MPKRRRLARSSACALLLLAACAASRAPEESAGVARITATRELRVGTTGDQPPFSMASRSGELVGLDVALVRVLAQSIGVNARLVQLPFAQLLDSLEAGDVDLVMSGMTITPERSKRAIFVGPYYTSGKGLLTRSPALASAAIKEDLDRPELRFAALAGSTSEDFVRRSLPRAQLVTTPKVEESVQLVLDGKVDALIADRETCAVAVLRWPHAGLLESEAVFTVEPMGIAVARDDPQLANLVQTYLNALASRGVLEKASAFWLRDPSWVKDIW